MTWGQPSKPVAHTLEAREYRLYFGRTRYGGLPISDGELALFLAREVDSKLTGYSLDSLIGYYVPADRKQAYQEPCTLLIYASARASDYALLVSIANVYCRDFQQTSVLLTASPLASCEFVGSLESSLCT